MRDNHGQGDIDEELGFEDHGTVEELRKRFASFIQSQSEGESVQRRLTELALRHTWPTITQIVATTTESVDFPLAGTYKEEARRMLREVQFLKFFLSSRYFEQLDEGIRHRVQRPGVF
ncbi:unnamed protein product [Ceratitis capitata]|uniref:(Mediterranean fruit fly) hypothetical protein n=1 Tax=Ceratitis capitata TaxID=7213 RepID=A0A811URA1_CERCA|nr:unnamed protein product [Ceratitis capitata]